MNEFELIGRYLAPLAGEGAFGLQDDAALLGEHVVTKDLLVDGIHFRTEDGWDAAAQKAVRANVSDIVAMGATPEAVFLGVVWPGGVAEKDVRSFSEGLGADLRAYGLSLMGGDTTRHQAEEAPLTVSITMTGRPGPRGPILRSGAKPGDIVYVTGTIGDGYLGLLAQLNRWKDYPNAVEHYCRPTPPVAIVESIGSHASSAIDISDGLIADAGHIATASRVALRFDAMKIPFSDEARMWADAGGDRRQLLTGGDDYQTLMSVHPDRRRFIEGAARETGVRLTAIGEVEEGTGDVAVIDGNGKPVAFDRSGYSHF